MKTPKMKTRQVFFLVLTLILPLSMQAQITPEWESLLLQLTTIDDVEAASYEEYYEQLSELELNPININTATREDLEQLPFLNDRQIEDICAYLYSYGPILTVGELAMIESLDFQRRQLLCHFITVGERPQRPYPSLKEMLLNSRHDLLLSASIPTYERRGDKQGYLGDAVAHSFRYQLTHYDKLRVGIVGAKSAGEPFFSHGNGMGYDFYTFYVQLKKMGRLKNLVVGRYDISTGMGLVLNNRFSIGKISSITNSSPTGVDLRPHASKSENAYMQGAAATITVAEGLDITPFISYRGIDATLTADGEIANIVESGYHRTQTEMDKKNNRTEMVGGANIHYFIKGFHVGATATYTAYSRPLVPNTDVEYRKYYPEGKNFFHASLDYGYMGHQVSVAGETAYGGDGIATINTVHYQCLRTLALVATQRYYAYNYAPLHSNALSEGGRTQNENAGALGLQWMPSAAWKITAYSDYTYFDKATYMAGPGAHSWDNLVQATYSDSTFTVTARYRIRERNRYNESQTANISTVEHRAHLSFSYNSHSWLLQTHADMAQSNYQQSSFGWMAGQQVGWKPTPWLRLDASVAYFHTDDNNSRIYAYETSMLRQFAYRSFSGEGVRYTFMLRAQLMPSLTLIAKMGTTDYFDRSQISSGLQLIDHSAMTDIDIQLRWKF